MNNFVGVDIHTLINRKTYGFISSENEDYLSCRFVRNRQIQEE